MMENSEGSPEVHCKPDKNNKFSVSYISSYKQEFVNKSHERSVHKIFQRGQGQSSQESRSEDLFGKKVTNDVIETSNRSAYRNHGFDDDTTNKTRYGCNKEKNQYAIGIIPANVSSRPTDHWLPGSLDTTSISIKQPFQYLTRRRKKFSVDQDAAGAPPTCTATTEYHRFYNPSKRRGKVSPRLTIVSNV